MADKYVVFKIGDWLDEWKQHEDSPEAEHILTDLQRHRIPDAHVIRGQDVFAAPALHSYAASIAVAMRVLESHNGTGQFRKEIRKMQEAADYFHNAAVESEQIAWKVPD
jgi:hypothetical protein